jgi:hypothetical protein
MQVADNRTINLLLGKGNKIEWFMGQPTEPLTPPKIENYGKNGIRKVLIEKKKEILGQTGDPKKGLIVLIKPSEKSNYRNLVDVLDEMKIINPQTYAIGDISPMEIDLLKRDNLF